MKSKPVSLKDIVRPLKKETDTEWCKRQRLNRLARIRRDRKIYC